MKRLAIVGGGSWGTGLACVLTPRFEHTTIWVHNPVLAAEMRGRGENATFLPGIRLPEQLRVTSDLGDAVGGADVVLGVMPSHVVREIYGKLKPYLGRGVPVVSATKGLESDSLLRMSQVIGSVLGPETGIVVLSGPSFASEVALGHPTAVVAASCDEELAGRVQCAFSGRTFRVYASGDPVGVEIGGALKNVIAIGAGMCDGLGLGNNAVAALITRGLAEIIRLAEIIGAKRDTLSGLAGLGDLVLTCTGEMSRNRQVGRKLAGGMALGEITRSTQMVAEGVKTSGAAVKLAAQYGVEMPIASEVHAVLSGKQTPEAAIDRLMSRSLRREIERR